MIYRDITGSQQHPQLARGGSNSASLLMLVLDTDKALGGRQRGPAGFQPCRAAPQPRSPAAPLCLLG